MRLTLTTPAPSLSDSPTKATLLLDNALIAADAALPIIDPTQVGSLSQAARDARRAADVLTNLEHAKPYVVAAEHAQAAADALDSAVEVLSVAQRPEIGASHYVAEARNELVLALSGMHKRCTSE